MENREKLGNYIFAGAYVLTTAAITSKTKGVSFGKALGNILFAAMDRYIELKEQREAPVETIDIDYVEVEQLALSENKA